MNKLGGKHLGLRRLEEIGLLVPRYITIPFDELADFDTRIVEDVFGDCSNRLFAVRSSAVSEDGKAGAYAGLFETNLNVDFPILAHAINSVGRSGDSSRVKEYAEAKGFPVPEEATVSVIIQEMVDPDVSGVLLSYAPETSSEMALTEVIWGIGELLVAGKVEPDCYHFERSSGHSVFVRAGNQRYKLTKTGLERTTPQEVTNKKLSGENLKDLWDAMCLLEKEFKGPIDVEYCVVNNKIFYLQARPLVVDACATLS